MLLYILLFLLIFTYNLLFSKFCIVYLCSRPQATYNCSKCSFSSHLGPPFVTSIPFTSHCTSFNRIMSCVLRHLSKHNTFSRIDGQGRAYQESLNQYSIATRDLHCESLRVFTTQVFPSIGTSFTTQLTHFYSLVSPLTHSYRYQ